MPEPRDELDPDLMAALDRLNALIDSFEQDPDPSVQERALELLGSVDTIHRTCVTRLAAYLDELGGPFRKRLLADPLIRMLFELYDLVPGESPGFIPLDEIEIVPPANR